MPKKRLTNEEAEALAQELASLTEALQRERADAINIRRQHGEQLKALQTNVKIELVKSLLPVIDNFERSLGHVPKELEDNSYIQGISSIVKQFDSALRQLGVEKIATLGEEFDPAVHEAVTMEEGDGEQEVITQELQTGYKLDGQVIRPAMVAVARR